MYGLASGAARAGKTPGRRRSASTPRRAILRGGIPGPRRGRPSLPPRTAAVACSGFVTDALPAAVRHLLLRLRAAADAAGAVCASGQPRASSAWRSAWAAASAPAWAARCETLNGPKRVCRDGPGIQKGGDCYGRHQRHALRPRRWTIPSSPPAAPSATDMSSPSSTTSTASAPSPSRARRLHPRFGNPHAAHRRVRRAGCSTPSACRTRASTR